jgi:hypothetical protein
MSTIELSVINCLAPSPPTVPTAEVNQTTRSTPFFFLSKQTFDCVGPNLEVLLIFRLQELLISKVWPVSHVLDQDAQKTFIIIKIMDNSTFWVPNQS